MLISEHTRRINSQSVIARINALQVVIAFYILPDFPLEKFYKCLLFIQGCTISAYYFNAFFFFWSGELFLKNINFLFFIN